ncbi:MAG: hypothetical protein V1702_00895 [Candidatus Woesearchaeota archaeon]
MQELASFYEEERRKQWGPKLEDFRAKFEALPFPQGARVTKDYPDVNLNRQHNVPLDMYIKLEYPDMVLIPTYTNPKVPITAKWGSPTVWLPGALIKDLRLTFKHPIEMAWREGEARNLKMHELVRPSESAAGYLETSWQDSRGYFWSQAALGKRQQPKISVLMGEAGFHYDFWAIRNAYFHPKAIGSGEIDALLEHLKLNGKPARPRFIAKTE